MLKVLNISWKIEIEMENWRVPQFNTLLDICQKFTLPWRAAWDLVQFSAAFIPNILKYLEGWAEGNIMAKIGDQEQGRVQCRASVFYLRKHMC